MLFRDSLPTSQRDWYYFALGAYSIAIKLGYLQLPITCFKHARGLGRKSTSLKEWRNEKRHLCVPEM